MRSSQTEIPSSPPPSRLGSGRRSVYGFRTRIAKTISRALKPKPKQTVSEWADEYRYLSSEASAEPGKWSTSRTPYLREFQDAFGDEDVTDVVGVFGSQLGKTEALNNVLGYYMHREPSPILFVQPTLDLARSWSKLRLVNMIRDTPVLRDLFGDPTSKKTGQEILEKVYPGGHLAIAGANSPGGLAGRPRRIVLGDELDRWPLSAGAEGSPVELSRKRTTTFHNRVHGWISSPGIAGESQIWDLWELSDKRRWWCPCPHCGERQTLKWANVRIPEADEVDGQVERARAARYECEFCGAHWDDAERWEAIQAGEWRAEREGTSYAGFHLNAIASPWLTLEELASEWLEAQGDVEKLKVFINTRLAELWEDVTIKIEAEKLLERRENYGPKVPDQVLVITAGVDVQDDRLELEIVGWGRGSESWSLDYRILDGDPSNLLTIDPNDPDRDTALDDEIHREFVREDGTPLRISATCIDSGGHFTDEVIRFASARIGRRVFAIKGVAGEGKPLWPYRGKQARVKGARRFGAHNIGVDTGKRSLMHRLMVEEPGTPLYCHFPDRDIYDLEYFEQLVGETLEPVRYVRGRKQPRRWKQTRDRVEALDCRNYAQAALASLAPNWERLEINLEKARKRKGELEEADDQVELEQPSRRSKKPKQDQTETDEQRSARLARHFMRQRRRRR